MPTFLTIFLMLLIPISVHAADITTARFTHPTERYDHCVLGDCVEYEGVEAMLADGGTLSFRLGQESVFEDIAPRLVPAGPEGQMAILVVRAYLDRGAALALLMVDGGELRIVAESAAIGTSHRWQNPVGFADFDGDGVDEIATVITPHIGGILTLYERRGKALVLDKAVRGFSNHRYGSPILNLHEILDWNQDGVADILLPTVSRKGLQVVSFASGAAEVIAAFDAGGQIEGPVMPVAGGVSFTMADGSVQTWQP